MPAGIAKPKSQNGLIKVNDCYDYFYKINEADKFHKFLQRTTVQVDKLNRSYLSVEDFEKFEQEITGS